MDGWTSRDDRLLTDLLFDSNLSYREIATQLLVSERFLKEQIKRLGLHWVRRRSGAASRGQAALASIMRRLIPGETVVCEEPIGERLRLDVYCPRYKLAAEYHGRQHFEYVDYFHGDTDGFLQHQRRDERKEEICRDLGIALVTFRYNDDLSETAVFERMVEALRTTPSSEEVKKKTMKGQPIYESWKKRNREYSKMMYAKMKGTRGGRSA